MPACPGARPRRTLGPREILRVPVGRTVPSTSSCGRQTTRPSAMTTAVFALSNALLLLFISVVQAGVLFTNDEYNIQAGVPFTLTWTGAKAPVTITVMNGPDVDLQEVLVIDCEQHRWPLARLYPEDWRRPPLTLSARTTADKDPGTSFTWTPPSTLPPDSYELRISDGVSEDYSARFSYPGPGSSSTPTAPSSTATDASRPASTNASGGGDAGLTTGAKAGIGVGVTLAALLILGGIAIFIYKRGKAAGRRTHVPQEMDGAGQEATEAKPKLAPEVNLDQPIYELRGSGAASELEGHRHHQGVLAELSAEPRSRIEASAAAYPGQR